MILIPMLIWVMTIDRYPSSSGSSDSVVHACERSVQDDLWPAHDDSSWSVGLVGYVRLPHALIMIHRFYSG